MLFESSRIYLRKMTEADVELYHQWRNDMAVMQTTSPHLELVSLDDTRQFVTQVILGSNTSKNYMIVDKENHEAVGITAIVHMDDKNRNGECILELGNKAYWGKGYGTEALQLLLHYAFLECNLHRMALRVFSFNDRAIRLYHKLGFKQEGISRQSIYREGQWHDIIHMGMLQEEYRAAIVHEAMISDERSRSVCK
ncbi:GNAT family N-acetyltransferase [Paenibacillus aquistagni]|uniref:GNAT family N-acetyltransferase n=1 Tax=Paenibacillus aquistagni TaxID=1852522 RepID=UPI00145A1CE4|nr:GNAT family protein [Paenibacillus aquistagni]NMM55504.1 GNAT family N-acetyltransferase [Paenibacillus aquistagni]